MSTSTHMLQVSSTARYVIVKPSDLQLPYLNHAEMITPAGSNKSFVFVTLTALQAIEVAKLLKGKGSIQKNQEHNLNEELDMDEPATLNVVDIKEAATKAASIYLTNRMRCNNCNTKSTQRPTIFIVMDGRINPNKKNNKGQKIFNGLNIEQGPRFAPDESGPCIDHGNQVLALYCGKQNAGMIPNCNKVVEKIVTVEVFSCKSGKTDTENIIKSWLWVAEYTKQNIARYNIVVNESIDALSKYNVGAGEAIRAAVQNGAIVFFPSGNNGSNRCDNAPNLQVPGVFAVGGTTNGNWVDFYSNWGPCVKAYFPFAVSDYNNKAIKGTSFAVTFAGVLGLCILGQNPKLTREELYKAILSRMTVIDPQRWHNYGLPTRITEKAKFCDLPLYNAQKAKTAEANQVNKPQNCTKGCKY